jgi:hypothetical protein
MPSIGQTWALASIGAVVEMGVLGTLKRLLSFMESIILGTCISRRANTGTHKESYKRLSCIFQTRRTADSEQLQVATDNTLGRLSQ